MRFLIILVVSLPVNITANVLRVPAQYSTIQSAINASSPNDTVLISSGLYYENINFRGKSIVVKGAAAADSVLLIGSHPANPDSSSVVTFCTAETTSSVLDGVTITGGAGTVTSIGKIGGGIYISGAFPLIRNCIIRENHANLGGGIGEWGPPDGGPRIENCLIINDTAIGSGRYGGGVWLHYSSGSLQHCTIAQNVADNGSNLTLTGFAYYVPVSNSILWAGSIYGYEFLGSFNYCDIQGGWSSGSGNIDSNPVFCDPGSSNFHLAANSPCLGSGEGNSTIGALDLGCDSIFLGVAEDNVLTKSLQIFPNYPNPFNPVTTIMFDLPKASHVRLSVFDLRGRTVALLLDRNMQAGRHATAFDASDFSTGTYFFRLSTADRVLTQKMVLQK